MSNVRIYYNPACSKCREARALLEARGLQLELIEYLSTTPSRDALLDVARKLGGSPLQMVRTKEAAFGATGLSAASSAEQVVEAILKVPALLERPIVVHGERAVVARPPELALALFA